MSMEKLVATAVAAREKAYAPYSKYQVGAAVLAASGKIYAGCNIENASYSITLCAERVALSNAIAAGEREFHALAIAGGDGQPSMPCGACRQFMAEWTDADFPIIIVSKQGARQETTFGRLLPCPFGPDALQEER